MKTLIAALLACVLSTAQAVPQSTNSELSGASELISDGSAALVGGSLAALLVTGSVVVASVNASGEAVDVVLEGVGDASRATVRLSGAAAKKLSVAAGSTVKVLAVSTGHVLVASGKVLAFIPNEAGKALIHHSGAGVGK